MYAVSIAAVLEGLQPHINVPLQAAQYEPRHEPLELSQPLAWRYMTDSE